MVDALKALYPDLETIFVDQHISLLDLVIECDERLQMMLPDDTKMEADLAKFKELFTF
mgnify:FL=1